MHGLPRILIFFVTREEIWQRFSLVTLLLMKIIAKSPHLWQKIGVHGTPYIILHIMQGCYMGSNEVVSEATMVNYG